MIAKDSFEKTRPIRRANMRGISIVAKSGRRDFDSETAQRLQRATRRLSVSNRNWEANYMCMMKCRCSEPPAISVSELRFLRDSIKQCEIRGRPDYNTVSVNRTKKLIRSSSYDARTLDIAMRAFPQVGASFIQNTGELFLAIKPRVPRVSFIPMTLIDPC